MPTDPSIILQGQQPQIDFANIYATAMQLRSMKQQNDTQNALRAILAQPDSVDQTSGSVTPNALAKIARIDPKTAADLAAKSSEVAERKAQIAHTTSETAAAQQKQDTEFLSGAVGEYDASLATGGTAPDIAASNLKQAIRDHIQAQPYSQDQKDAAWAKFASMSPAQIRAASLDSQQRFEMQKQTAQDQAELERQTAAEKANRTPATMGGRPISVDRQGTAYDPNTGEQLKVTAPIIRQEPGFNPQAAAEKADDRAPTLLTDPETQQQYWAYPGNKDEPPTYKDLQGKPYQPSGAAHIQSGVVRGGIAGAIQAAQAENAKEGKGPLTADQIEQISADYTRKTRSAVAFASGKQGDQVRFLNVAIDHLGTLEQLGLALKNGDVQVVNKIANEVAAQLGVPAPTNFNAVRQIVSQEVHKGVAGVGGSAGEREDLAQQASLASSPEQLIGVIKSVEKLMAGQAAGLGRQYENATGLDNFDDLLSPKARDLLGAQGGGDTVPAGAPPPKFTAPTIGSVAADAKGHKIRLTKDGWVDAETGKPVS